MPRRAATGATRFSTRWQWLTGAAWCTRRCAPEAARGLCPAGKGHLIRTRGEGGDWAPGAQKRLQRGGKAVRKAAAPQDKRAAARYLCIPRPMQRRGSVASSPSAPLVAGPVLLPKERACLLSAARPQPRWPLECGRRGRHGPRQARAALPPRSPLSLARTGGAAALRLREQQKRRRPWSLLPRVRRRRPPGSGADDVPWAASVRKSHMAACSLYVSGLPPLTL